VGFGMNDNKKLFEGIYLMKLNGFVAIHSNTGEEPTLIKLTSTLEEQKIKEALAIFPALHLIKSNQHLIEMVEMTLKYYSQKLKESVK
jgi:hypothetical protein